METPSRRARAHGTPSSSRHRSAVKTPKSVLTPNDDAAEKASIRRKRRSQALRLSLSDAFAGQSDQHRGQQQSDSDRRMLSEAECNAMFEMCLKLSTENKINDRNVWSLEFITHLPDIVRTSKANFQKMSGGLEAGVTIYSKRVDLTFKHCMSLGSYAQKPGADDGGDDGYENEAAAGDDDADGIEDAAAAAAKAQKQQGRRARQGESADEEATLTTAEQLRAKKGDSTLAVDPLFHSMSALFDEGGAKGLLLLNRSVYSGAHILTCPQDVPEQCFPLQAQPQCDTLLDLRPLQQQLTACSSSSGSAESASGPGAVLTPDLHRLYSLLEETQRAMPGRSQQEQQQQQEALAGVDVAGIMQQALRNLPPTPMPRLSARTQGNSTHSSSPAAAPGAAVADPGGDVSMADADSAPVDGACTANDGQYSDEQQYDGSGSTAEGPGSTSVPVVASFLAACEAAGDGDVDDAVGMASDAGGYDDAEGGGYGDDGHPGYGDDDAWGQQQQQAGRRQSLLGLGAEQDAEEGTGLDAEALQQLLGAAAGTNKAGTVAGSGWAGSRFWKYRSAAAAAARMASGTSGGAVKRAAAAAGTAASRSSRSAPFRIDFTARPADLESLLAPGSSKQTCLVSAPASSTADTLLPEDLHYQASSLLQLFLHPTSISSARQQQGPPRASGSGDPLASWAEAGDEQEGGWGGDDGYSNDGDDYDTGAEGYNAGDLSIGDPGFSGTAAGGGEGGAEWWSADGELLSAPKRMTGGGVNYQRSAKQVDVRALKDILWDSLLSAKQQDSCPTQQDSTAPTAAGTSAAGDSIIPFQDVIVHVPAESAAGALEDVSVHMCFICLLHLANEKGLVVKAHEDLKTLTVSNVQQQ